jgi:sugar fermentation stimulation protein A
MYLEVKRCTLEQNGVVMFPDAPTQRGLKHIEELIECVNDGYEAVLLILVQMENVKYFTPNYATHKEFGDAMKLASQKGVKLMCYDCLVAPDSLTVNKKIEIVL